MARRQRRLRTLEQICPLVSSGVKDEYPDRERKTRCLGQTGRWFLQKSERRHTESKERRKMLWRKTATKKPEGIKEEGDVVRVCEGRWISPKNEERRDRRDWEKIYTKYHRICLHVDMLCGSIMNSTFTMFWAIGIHKNLANFDSTGVGKMWDRWVEEYTLG